MVYGIPDRVPVAAGAPRSALGPYARSKRDAEDLPFACRGRGWRHHRAPLEIEPSADPPGDVLGVRGLHRFAPVIAVPRGKRHGGPQGRVAAAGRARILAA